MSDTHGAAVEAIADLTRMGEPVEWLEGPGAGVGVVRSRDGQAGFLDLYDFLGIPRGTRRAIDLADTAAFVAYVNRHRTTGTEIYYVERSFRAIIDGHADPESGPGGCHHTVGLELRYSRAFEAWANNANFDMSQVQLAEMIQDRLGDITDPDAADLLELVSFLQGSISTTWTSATRLHDGARTLQWSEHMTAQGNVAAGGTRDVPETFTVAVPLFEHDADTTTIRARVRYRIRDGVLTLRYDLIDVEDLTEARVEAVAGEIEAGVGTKPLPVRAINGQGEWRRW